MHWRRMMVKNVYMLCLFCFVFLLLLCVFFNRIFFKLNQIFCILALVSKLLFITRINIYISFLPPVYWICIKGAVEVNTPIFGKSEASALLNHFVNVVATKLFWLFFFYMSKLSLSNIIWERNINPHTQTNYRQYLQLNASEERN